MLWLVLLFSCTYSALATEWNCAAADGVFTLSTDCTINNDIDVTNLLNITGVPDAAGNLIKLDGGNLNRIFKVKAGGYLIVRNLNLTGGYTTKRGGAVEVGGSKNVTAKAHFYNSVFHGNSAINAAKKGTGGAVYITRANFSCSNCIFRGNTATRTAGALYAFKDNVLFLSETLFENNLVLDGDALSVASPATT